MIIRGISASFLFLALIYNAESQPTGSISASQINASSCSIIMIGGANRDLAVNPQCNASPKVFAALRSIAGQLSTIKSQQRLSGDRETAFIEGANAWFPILETQLAQVDTDILAAIVELRADLNKRFGHGQTADDISFSFIDLKDKKIAGFPLSKCGCDPNYNEFSPDAMFSIDYPDQRCLSGHETVEACVITEKSVCQVVDYRATPTWWRVCTK